MGRKISGTLSQLAESLIACGVPEREVTRVIVYFERYGMWQFMNLSIFSFVTPSCGDDDCIEPSHQVLNIP